MFTQDQLVRFCGVYALIYPILRDPRFLRPDIMQAMMASCMGHDEARKYLLVDSNSPSLELFRWVLENYDFSPGGYVYRAGKLATTWGALDLDYVITLSRGNNLLIITTRGNTTELEFIVLGAGRVRKITYEYQDRETFVRYFGPNKEDPDRQVQIWRDEESGIWTTFTRLEKDTVRRQFSQEGIMISLESKLHGPFSWSQNEGVFEMDSSNPDMPSVQLKPWQLPGEY